MPANTPPARYGALSIALHWLMLVLITAVCLLMELKSLAPRGSAQRATMAHAHYSLGLAVFVLVWLRLAARRWEPVWRRAVLPACSGSCAPIPRGSAKDHSRPRCLRAKPKWLP